MAAKANLKYHVVLVTKYRKGALRDIESSVYDAMRYAEEHSSIHIEAMGVEDGNHIHLILRLKPTYSLSSIVNRLKTMSTNYLYLHEGKHLKQFYWKKHSRKLWNGGYWVSTIGNVSIDKAIEYVKKQQFNMLETRYP